VGHQLPSIHEQILTPEKIASALRAERTELLARRPSPGASKRSPTSRSSARATSGRPSRALPTSVGGAPRAARWRADAGLRGSCL